MQVKKINTISEFFSKQKNEFKFVLFSSPQSLSWYKDNIVNKTLILNLHSGKLWKLDGTNLSPIWYNRHGGKITLRLPKYWGPHDDEWNLIPEGTMFCIQNNYEQVLGINDDEVVLEGKDENENGQLWIKGKENVEGYFTLKNFKSSKFLTKYGSKILTKYGYSSIIMKGN